MTTVYVARPSAPSQPLTPHQSYSLSPEAQALKPIDLSIVKPLTYDSPGKGRYATDGGFVFNLELNILDTLSKLPIRGVEVKVGETKKFTDRLGQVFLRLNRGYNKIFVSGIGYLEKGNFAPESTRFEPMVLEVDLDEDSIFTVYSSGQVIPGERRVLDNPGHGGINSSELGTWLRENWWMLALGGGVGVGLYYLGKGRSPSH